LINPPDLVTAQLAIGNVGADGAGRHIEPVCRFRGGDQATLRDCYVGIAVGHDSGNPLQPRDGKDWQAAMAGRLMKTLDLIREAR